MTEYDDRGQRKLHPESKWHQTAEELRAGAAALEHDAHNLQGRGNPQDHPAVSARKLAAAADVRALADSIEGTPGGMYESEYQRLHAVAEAARCEGILIDSPVPYRGFAEDDDTYGAGLQYWHDRRVGKLAAVELGDLVRVADPGQVPFFALKSYGGWTEAVIPDEPTESRAIGIRLQEEQDRAAIAATEAVRLVSEGRHNWSAAIEESGLDEVRAPDKWSQEKRVADRAEQPHTRSAAERAEWDAIGQAEIEQEQARLEKEQAAADTGDSRNWDRSPETDADKRFHDLRDSGYRGPIDQDGNAVTSGPDAAALKRMAEQRGEDTSWWTGDDVTITSGPEADAPTRGRTFGGGVQERADGGGVFVRGDGDVVMHSSVFEGPAAVVPRSEQADSSSRVSADDDVMEA